MRKTMTRRTSARNAGAEENHVPRCSACGKASYKSAHHARQATRSAGNRIRVYWCPDGNVWHVTKEKIGARW